MAADSATPVYLCPGESRAIDRAAHLGRLAAFYPECRHCAHRHDAHGLHALQLGHWAEIERRGRPGPQFTTEGIVCATAHELDTAVMRRLAAALGTLLARDRQQPAPPAVIVGALGHWNTAELVASACETLQWYGCRTLEAGAVTSASLAGAARRIRADAAMLIGNWTGEPHAIGVKLWGAGGCPWSSPGELQRVAELYAAPGERPRRRGGGLERALVTLEYLAPLAPMFHGLRPLRLVLDTRCEPLLSCLRQLNSTSACELLTADGPLAGERLSESARDSADRPFVERRLEAVSREVLEQRAHFGLWIDGDGERCQLVDERGRRVGSETLFLTLAGYICRQRPAAVMVLEREASAELERAVVQRGARAVRGDATREAMCQRLARTGAVFAGGTSGRFWYAGEAPGDWGAADALWTLALLLSLLSESDRPLSEVLDAV